MTEHTVVAENLGRVYRVAAAGFYDPGGFYESYGGRFLYEVLTRSVERKTVVHALRSVSFSVGEGEFVYFFSP